MSVVVEFLTLALSRRTPIVPRYCLWCGRTVKSISERQQRAALRDGEITCKCGTSLGFISPECAI